MIDEMEEIWALYADDGTQALDAMEAALLALGQGGGAEFPAHVAALFRAVHTFKGNSRVLGLSVVESRAHLAEDLIGLVRDHGLPWDEEIADVLLEVADTLRTMLDETVATRADVAPQASEALMDRLAACIERAGSGSTLLRTAPPPAPEPVSQGPAAAVDEPPPAEIVAGDAGPAPARATAGLARLADDPVYRAIFRDMVADAVATLAALPEDGPADAPAAARKQAEGLRHAARQIGLDLWDSALEAFLSGPDVRPKALSTLLLSLEQPSGPGVSTAQSAPETRAEPSFLDVVRDPLTVIAAFDKDSLHGDMPFPEDVSAALRAICDAARAAGYVRVDQAAAHLSTAGSAVDFLAAELQLYEELAAIEAVLPDAVRTTGLSPRDKLRAHHSEHVFSYLSEVAAVLDRMSKGGDPERDHMQIERLLRCIHHACAHHGMERGEQLSMAIVDVLARHRMHGRTVDSGLIHLARSFIDRVEGVFDALTQGRVEQTHALDGLSDDLSRLCFLREGLATVSSIEGRLGLPRDFRRVLSPQCLRAALDAIDDGLRFFVIRADINTDDALAKAFMGWLSSGAARSITNVTMFIGAETVFDFLVASPLEEVGVRAALAALDPPGHRLRLTHVLVAAADPPAAMLADPDAGPAPAAPDPAGPSPVISAAVIERIGEIAAGQSMISQMLAELAEQDIFAGVDILLRGAAPDWTRARSQMRAFLAGHGARLRELAQLEAQVLGQITRLREETVELRARRIDTIFPPLRDFVQTQARRNRHQVALSFAGGDLTMDVSLLESLRRLLRNLTATRLAAACGVRRIHMSFARDEDRVVAVIEDDGDPAKPAISDGVHATAAAMDATLRHVVLPGAGLRFQVALPVGMVVMDGLVVGIGGIRYVLPVDAVRVILQPGYGRLIRASAAEGQEWLRIARDEIVTVRPLSPGHGTAGQGVFVVLSAQGLSVAVPVDEVIGQQLVHLRPLKGVLAGLPNLTGIALLAGGEVGMVVSVSGLCAAPGHGPGDPSFAV